MRYESVGLVVYRCQGRRAEIWPGYPTADSSVHYAKFFDHLYNIYDLRYAYPDSSGKSYRKAWLTKEFGAASAFDEATNFPWKPRSEESDIDEP